MRLPNLVCYTVTALAAGSLAAQANSGTELDPLSPLPETDGEEAQSFLDPATEIAPSRDRLPQQLDAAPETIALQPEALPSPEVATEVFPVAETAIPETTVEVALADESVVSEVETVVPEIAIAEDPVAPEIETVREVLPKVAIAEDPVLPEMEAETVLSDSGEPEITATPPQSYDVAPESFSSVPESPEIAVSAPESEASTEISNTVQALQPDAEAENFGIESRAANLNDVVASTTAQSSNCATTAGTQLAQATASCPRPRPYRAIAVPDPYEFESSPALSIYIPVGYGTEKNAVFLTGNYQASVRNDPGSVANGGIGIGLGDAKNAVGVELSYAFANNPNAGEGGFNAKLHRRIGNDLSVAVGWNGFLNIGRHDWEHSLYGVATQVFRTQDSLDKPFSRVAVTAGVGSNQFRSNGARLVGDNNANVFGNVAVRVLRPVSLIAEWTGQDLGVGLSVAPIRNFPLVITPAVRDLAGNEFRPRFVLTGGMAFRF